MSNVFYMPAPSFLGVWDGSGVSPEFKENVSVFKFVQEGDNAAEFSVCDDLTAQRAVLGGLRRGWTSAIAVSKDFAPANATGVIMIKAGTAEKQADGGWKVAEKAEIDFTM
jgi:hypothetical protein